MSIDKNGAYYFSEKFKEQMQKCLDGYLRTNSNKLGRKYYAKISKLLCGVESKFYVQYPEGAADLRIFARFRIKEKLAELDGKYQNDDDKNDSKGWTECKIKIESVAKRIWKIWCNERERCPRVGVVFIDINRLEILLTRYTKDGEIQWGHPKGKMEYGEYLIDCGSREANEEVGVDRHWLYAQLQGIKPIKKSLYNQNIGEVVEHYYYIVPVSREEIRLKPNGIEIEGCEWHSIFTIECPRCSEKDPISIKRDPRKTNYFMVNCTDCYDHTSLILDVCEYVDKINGNDVASTEYKRLHKHSRFS